jgi:hypothetical protein
VFDAPSISDTSIDEPSDIAVHEGHLPHGSGVGPFEQFNAFARILAVDVLPIPLGPEKIYACAALLVEIAFFSIRAIGSCPTRSSKVCGLHFLAKTK